MATRLTTQFGPLSEVQADWLIIPVWEDDSFSPEVSALDDALGGKIARLRERGDITGKYAELVPILDAGSAGIQRLLVAGLGDHKLADRPRLIDAAAAAARAVTGKKRSRIAFALPGQYPGSDWRDVTIAVAAGLMSGSEGPGRFKKEPSRFAPDEICLVAPPSGPASMIREAAAEADVQGRAISLARELVNAPPDDLYPESFAERARSEAASRGIECEVFDQGRLERERMRALLAVARGSERPPRLVLLRYLGGGNGPTLGLVGKGVTFDSGGLSLKPTDGMVDMKCDMAGAAAVFGAVLAIAELKLPVNVLGVLPLVENLPSGKSMKLGDVLRTRAGKTIEVLNTDAEGRLILADALQYAVDQKVSHLVDLATLTGACMVALGHEVAGLMTNNPAWADRVRQAADRAGERVWPLPMFPHYGEMIRSNVADMKNTGGSRYGGAITAAKLLEQFVGDVPWAHLDIAGPAFVEHETASRDPGGTGCFVRTLVELARVYDEDAS